MKVRRLLGKSTHTLSIVGTSIGLVVAAVDNLAFEGEISPIVIIIMLFIAGAAYGILWYRRGWLAALHTWGCVPLIHLVKHMLGLPDTLHPNTYGSIMMLAGVSLVVIAAGFGFGILLRRLTRDDARQQR